MSAANEWVCDSSQQVNKNCTSEPTMKLFVYFISTEISFKQKWQLTAIRQWNELYLLIRSLKIQHLFKISKQWNEFYSLESVKTSTFSFQNFSKGKRGNFKASDI